MEQILDQALSGRRCRCEHATVYTHAELSAWLHAALPDDWTVVTKDHSLSAQWEHTLLVTEDGVEILTPSGKAQ